MKKTTILAAAAVLVGEAGIAGAMLADIPLEIIAQQSELIVLAEVLEAAEAVQMELKLPDSPRPVNAWFSRYKLKVTRVIKQQAKPAAEPGERKLVVISRSPRPPQPGKPIVHVSDAYYASLRTGRSYVLILRKLPGKNEYYLPSYPKNYRPARPEEIARIEKAADAGKWPWGKPVNGLQIALLPGKSTVKLHTIAQRVRGRDGKFGPRIVRQNAYVASVIALRNVSKGPIAVSLYPEDRFLSVKATGPGGEVVTPDFYSRLARMDLRAFGPWATARIAPGQLLFIGPMGKGDYGLGMNLALSAGKWKLQAAYTAKRGGIYPGKDAGEKLKLWTGTITSRPVKIQVNE